MKYRSGLLFSICALLFVLSSCTQQDSSGLTPAPTTPTPTATATAGPSNTIPNGQLYTDPQLGFHLTIPPTWQAHPQPGTQAAPGSENVQFTTTDEQSSRSLIILGVFHGSMMPDAFAQQGTPNTHVGTYPAFVEDRSDREGRAPCLVRL